MRTRELFASLTLKPQKLAIYTIYRREVITPTHWKHVNVLRLKHTLHSIKIDRKGSLMRIDPIYTSKRI